MLLNSDDNQVLLQTNKQERTLELGMACLFWSIQQPVVKRLVSKSNAAKLFTPVDIPGANAHSDFLGPCVFVVALTHSQQYSWRGCRGEQSWISLQNSRMYFLYKKGDG